jgi:hypothetical protein
MTASLKTCFLGALYGSVAVALSLALLALIGQIPKAPYVGNWQSLIGGGWMAGAVLGGLAFILIGALWGLPFSLVKNPTVLKGMLYGFVPSLFGWIVLPVILGGEMFGGFALPALLIPFVMNVLIWGSILGWYAQRHARTGAAAYAA